MPSNKPILTIRTSNELIERLRTLSEKENRSMSNMAETIIKDYLDNYEAQQNRAEQKSKLEKSSISRTG